MPLQAVIGASNGTSKGAFNAPPKKSSQPLLRKTSSEAGQKLPQLGDDCSNCAAILFIQKQQGVLAALLNIP
jgi:hypothetical protein